MSVLIPRQQALGLPQATDSDSIDGRSRGRYGPTVWRFLVRLVVIVALVLILIGVLWVVPVLSRALEQILG